MALIELAVTGMTFKFVNLAHSGTVTVTGNASTKVSSETKFVYLDTLTITIAGGTDGTVTGATGAGTMIATSLKTLIETKAPLRKGDQSIPITMTGNPPSGSSSPTTYVTIVEIDNPNQTKSLSE